MDQGERFKSLDSRFRGLTEKSSEGAAAEFPYGLKSNVTAEWRQIGGCAADPEQMVRNSIIAELLLSLYPYVGLLQP
jgi:hypothetical protein